MVRQYLDGYPTFRHLLMTEFYALTPCPRSQADWDVMEFVDPDAHEAVILAYRVRDECKRLPAFPRRLDVSGVYEIIDPFAYRKPRTAAGRSFYGEGAAALARP